MHKTAAYILFAAFIAVQFARQVSYAECLLSNYISGAGKQCDCEKIFKEKTGPEKSTGLPANHPHLHIDDVYYFTKMFVVQKWHRTVPPVHTRAGEKNWKDVITGSIDRPPPRIAFSPVLILM